MHFDIRNLLQAVSRRRSWLIVPTVSFTLIAVVYALFKQDYWTATQALYVRNESIGQNTPFGRFESVDAMQTAQETILEVAHQKNVLREALRSVGPRKKFWSKRKQEAWPTDENLEEFRKCVTIAAPHGAQFGRTEMIYLTVKAERVARAEELATAVTDQLVQHLRDMRRQKYKGILDELCTSTAIAQTELEKSVLKLAQLDKKLGSDVVEMRVINNASQGDGTLRRSLGEIRAEIRGAEADYSRKKMDRDQLVALIDEPAKLLALPSDLLDARPTLRRLKDSLVDAQVNVAQLSGEYNGKHPRMQAAVYAEQQVRQRVYEEIRDSVQNIDVELQLAQARVVQLRELMKQYESRFSDLSEERTAYNRLTQDVESKTAVVQQLEKDLATARANLATASSVSLVQKVDQPVASSRPVGPGGKSIVFAGMVGGLFVGLGLIWLAEPVKSAYDRRCMSVTGRRTNDRILMTAAMMAGGQIGVNGPGRRLTDQMLAMQNIHPDASHDASRS